PSSRKEARRMEMTPTIGASGDPRLRIAIVSTPRSGNTWLRGLLSHVYELEELAAHTPDEVAWDALPARCVLQIHWRRVEPFVSQLARHGFRVVAIARHPLDVLISALNYQYHTATRDRLPAPGEYPLLEATPRSEAFLAYACNESDNHVL